MLDRRYHLVHLFAVALLAAATIAVFLMWFAPRPAWGPDLSLSGTVPTSSVFTVTPVASPVVLDMAATETPVTLFKIADVFEKSNKANGYKVTVRSTNNTAGDCGVGATKPCLWLAGADAEDRLLLDLIRTDDAGGNQTAIDVTAAAGNWSSTTTKNKVGTTYLAKVTYTTGLTLRTEGAYAETLQFTFAVN
jgi:hypothetical protein